MKSSALWVALLGFSLALGCSNSPNDSSSSGSGGNSCTPGQSVACIGAEACHGSQVCNADGQSYSTCQCGDGTSGGSGSTGSSNQGTTTTSAGTTGEDSSSTGGGHHHGTSGGGNGGSTSSGTTGEGAGSTGSSSGAGTTSGGSTGGHHHGTSSGGSTSSGSTGGGAGSTGGSSSGSTGGNNGGSSTIQLVSAGTVVNSGTPAFGHNTVAGDFLVAAVGSNGTATTSASGWTELVHNSSTSLWTKANCAAHETAPVFTSGGSDLWSQLMEFSNVGAADQTGQASVSGPEFSIALGASDAEAGELLLTAGYWNGSNTGGAVTEPFLSDSAGDALTPVVTQTANAFGQYFGTGYGFAGQTGSAADAATLVLSVYAGGSGVMASLKQSVAPTPGTLSISTTSLLGGFPTVAYSQTLQAVGGKPDYTWSMTTGSLPSGITLSSAGVVSGTTSATGTFHFTAKVEDGQSNTATQALTLVITGTGSDAGVCVLIDTSPSVPDTNANCGGYLDSNLSGSNGSNTNVSLDAWAPSTNQPVDGLSLALAVTSPASWSVTANLPAGGASVIAYPNAWQEQLAGPSNLLSSYTSIYSSFSDNIDGDQNSGSVAEATYDFYVNSWATEIMIQHDFIGDPLRPRCDTLGLDIASATFGGTGGVPVHTWNLCPLVQQGVYKTYIWQLATGENMATGSVDVLAMLNWLTTHGNSTVSPYLPTDTKVDNGISWGFEVCSTGGISEFFQMNNFTITSTQ